MAAAWKQHERYHISPTFSVLSEDEIIGVLALTETRYRSGREDDSYEAVRAYQFLLRGGFIRDVMPADIYPEVREEWFPSERTIIPHDLTPPEGGSK